MDSSREQENLKKLYYKTTQKEDILKQWGDILYCKTGEKPSADILKQLQQLNNYCPEDREDKNEKNKMNKVKSNNKITPGSCEQSGLARDAVEVCVPEESGPIESETASKVESDGADEDTTPTHASTVSESGGIEVIISRLAIAVVARFYSSVAIDGYGQTCLEHLPTDSVMIVRQATRGLRDSRTYAHVCIVIVFWQLDNGVVRMIAIFVGDGFLVVFTVVHWTTSSAIFSHSAVFKVLTEGVKFVTHCVMSTLKSVETGQLHLLSTTARNLMTGVITVPVMERVSVDSTCTQLMPSSVCYALEYKVEWNAHVSNGSWKDTFFCTPPLITCTHASPKELSFSSNSLVATTSETGLQFEMSYTVSKVQQLGSQDLVSPKVRQLGSLDLVSPKVRQLGSLDLVSPKVRQLGSLDLVSPKVRQLGSLDLVSPKVRQLGSQDLVSPKVRQLGSQDLVSPKVRQLGSLDLVSPKVQQLGSQDLVSPKVLCVTSASIIDPHQPLDTDGGCLCSPKMELDEQLHLQRAPIISSKMEDQLPHLSCISGNTFSSSDPASVKDPTLLDCYRCPSPERMCKKSGRMRHRPPLIPHTLLGSYAYKCIKPVAETHNSSEGSPIVSPFLGGISSYFRNPENGNSGSESEPNSDEEGAGGEDGGHGEGDGSCGEGGGSHGDGGGNHGDGGSNHGDGGHGDEGNTGDSGGGGGGDKDGDGRGSGKSGVDDSSKKVKKRKKKKRGKKPGRDGLSGGRFPLAIAQIGHTVYRSETGSESGDEPPSAQGERAEDVPDEPNSFDTVNEWLDQPFRRSTGAGAKGAKDDGNRVTARLEEVAEKKQHRTPLKLDRLPPPIESSTVSGDTDQEWPSAVQENTSHSIAGFLEELEVIRKRKSSFRSSSTSELSPDEASTVPSIDTTEHDPCTPQQCVDSSGTAALCTNTDTWLTSDQPSSTPCVGGAQTGSLPAPAAPVPHNCSLSTLDEGAVSTMPPSVQVFAGSEEEQPVSSEPLELVSSQPSRHDVVHGDDDLVHVVVGPNRVQYRPVGRYSSYTSHHCQPCAIQEIPELSQDAPECLVLTPSEEEALARLGVRKKDLLVVLRELSKLSREDRPRQLIVGILTRVCKLASVVLQAGGTLGMQLMDALQIRVDSCSVLVQSDALTSILPPNVTSCGVPTCSPTLPPITPGHTPVSAHSSTVLHSSTGSSVSGMSLRHFIQLMLIKSGLHQDTELWGEVFRTLFKLPTRLTVCAHCEKHRKEE